LKACVSRTGSEGCVEDPAISGVSKLTINSRSVSIYICDNNQMIVLDEGLNNFVIKNENALTLSGCVSSTSDHFSIERLGLWQWVRGQ
jgi:hypothetical protein